MELYHDEDTLFKVRNALIKTCGERMADEAINNMLNAGILFREYAPEPEDCTNEKSDVMMASPVNPTEDPWFRQRCLELAIQNSTPGVNNPSVLSKAKEFETYLKGEQK